MNQIVGNLTEPVFRPPPEADSLLIAITNGCTHRCTFCSMYSTKRFSIRQDVSGIKSDIDKARHLYGDRVRKIFFEDGNAFTADTDLLVAVTTHARQVHPDLESVSAYAHANDINKKSDGELKRIAEAGFSRLYVGIESGDNEILKTVRKNTTQEDYVEAAHKCHRAGIAWTGIFLLGLAGNDAGKSRRHALESAQLINRMAPPDPVTWYISQLTLDLEPGCDLWNRQREGKFKPATSDTILNELFTMIAFTDDNLKNCVFSSNHISNYLALKGVLSRDKQAFLRTIENASKDANLKRFSLDD